MAILRPILLSVALIGLLVSGLMADKDKFKFGKISDAEWAMVAPADFPEANAIVLRAQADIMVTPDDITTEYKYRIKILTEEGIEEVGELSIRWDSEDDKVTNFRAHTVTPDGKKHKVKKSSIFNKSSGDWRTKSFAFPNLEPGAVIEYQYRHVSDNYYYLSPWYYQSSIYTIKSCVSATLANGFTYDALHQNVPPSDTKPEVEVRSDISYSPGSGAKLKTFTWTRENLPPVTDEPYMSCVTDYLSGIRFQIVKFENRFNFVQFRSTWPEKGKRADKFVEDYLVKKSRIKKLTDEVTAGLSSELEKSQAIFEYVKDNFTTIYDYGFWYFSDKKVTKMLKDKQGTGEEKNVLLVAMHREAGIEAYPVLISTRSHGKIESGYPDLRQFNEIIAYVQLSDGYNFLDATNKLSPYGILPPRCLSNMGLLLDGDKSELIRIKCLPVTSSRVDRTFMKITPDGLASCSTTCNFTGYYATSYAGRYERRTPEEFNDDYFLGRLDIEHELDTLECGRDSSGYFAMMAKYTTEELVTPLDENLLVKPTVFALRSNPFESKKRFFPVDFNYPYLYVNEVHISLEEGAAAFTLPEPMSTTIEGATFLRECEVKDGCAVIKSALKIDKTEYDPTYYSELREFFDKIAVASADEVAITLAGGE